MKTQSKKPVSQKDRTAKYRDSKREVPASKPSKKRKDLSFVKPPKGDPMAWLKCYLWDAFPSEFGQVHHEIKDGFMHSLATGDDTLILAPRGTGKSTIINGLTLYALLEGLTEFPVVLPWDAKAKNRALRFWKTQLCFNERIHRDYPEATAVFKESRGIGNRLTALTQGNEATGAMLAISEGIIILPNGLGAIGSSTINGNPRGMNYTSIDGRVIRPTLAIVDDPQDRDTAKSESLVEKTIETIDGDIKGMAGHDCRMPIIMNATVIEKNDVPERYASNPNWKVIRTGQVLTWPNGWNDKKSECYLHWLEWNEIRISDGDDACLAYFKEHEQVMTDGMTVSWNARFDVKRKQPNALYSAMVDFFTMGEFAFFAERQNAPIKRGVDVYNLTPDIVLKHATDRNAFELPDGSEVIITATDINPSYALTTATYAFAKDRTAHCLWYGKYEDAPLPTREDMSDTQKQQIIFTALMRHGEQLLAMPAHAKVWGIDGGGAQSTVAKRFSYEWNKKHPQMPVCVLYGRSGKSARISARNETIRRRASDGSWILCRDKDAQYGWTEWVLWNSDCWREVMQRAFVCELGATGSASLPKGHHREYAEHICREKLKGKVELNGKMFYDYEKSVGRNDYADATNMCFMLSDMQGISSDGIGMKVKQQQRQVRKIRHVAI